MLRITFVILAALAMAAEAKMKFGKCKERPTMNIDSKQILGKWLVYGTDEWSLQKCYNYTINRNFHVEENYRSAVLHWTESVDWTLDAADSSPELSFERKIMGFIPESKTWTVIEGSSFDSFMVLYHCGFVTLMIPNNPLSSSIVLEHSQIWVKDMKMLASIAKTIENVVAKIDYKMSDYYTRDMSVCDK